MSEKSDALWKPRVIVVPKIVKDRQFELDNTIWTLCQDHALKDAVVSHFLRLKTGQDSISRFKVIPNNVLLQALLINEVRLATDIVDFQKTLFCQDELVRARLRSKKVPDSNNLCGNLFIQGYYDLMYNLNQTVRRDTSLTYYEATHRPKLNLTKVEKRQ